LIYKGDESGFFTREDSNIRNSVTSNHEAAPAEDGEEDKKAKAPLRNQFNFSERAAQTVNNPYRV